MITESVLPPGIAAWIWPRVEWPDAAKCAADCVALGITCVIPQAGLGALAWSEKHRTTFESAGITICPGLGMDGTHTKSEFSDAIVAIVDAFGRCMLDWESPKRWETRGGNDLASNTGPAHVCRMPQSS